MNEQDLKDVELEAEYAKLDQSEPSANVDDAIRAAARRAVNAGPVPEKKTARTWVMPLALAATVLLTLSVAVQIPQWKAQDMGLEALDEMVQVSSPADVRDAPPQATVTARVEAKPAPVAVDRQKKTMPSVSSSSEAIGWGDLAADDESKPESLSPQSFDQRDDAFAFSATEAEPAAEARAAPRPAAPMDDVAQRSTGTASNGMLAKTESFSAANPETDAKAARERARSELAAQAQRQTIMRQQQTAAKRARSSADIIVGNAEQWLIEIRERLTNGQQDAAVALMDGYVKRFPDRPLPADLQAERKRLEQANIAPENTSSRSADRQPQGGLAR